MLLVSCTDGNTYALEIGDGHWEVESEEEFLDQFRKGKVGFWNVYKVKNKEQYIAIEHIVSVKKS